MGKHNEWRKIVKRERRRKIRTQKATERDKLRDLKINDFLKEQEDIEKIETEQIEIQNKIENDKWIKAELEAIEKWKALQQKNEQLLQRKLQQQAKLRLEWEKEKERKKKEEEALKEIELRNKKRQELFMNNLENFLNGDSVEPPKELQILYESKPGHVTCPFFTKTACCRFGDDCSRNHIYPGVTKVLLAANMFGHFGLENANFNEYDTDIMLEYDDSDTYKDFRDFFYDILPEFQKFGQVAQLKVCNNYEKHLRGNTYIEYGDVRCAVSAYRALHGRWYGGKQLSLQFCQLKSWKSAICGLQTNRRCPKGRSCNFLHVFKNPLKLQLDMQIFEKSDQSSRSWRWSESPERELSRKTTKQETETDVSKEKIIQTLNFHCYNDASPFYSLPVKTLLQIYKTTQKDKKNGFCENRLYYISNKIKCQPFLLSKRIVKRTFLYKLSFEWLENSLTVLLDMNVSGDRILRDLWVLKYNHKTIEERLLRVKNSGIDTLYPWMVRCSEDILSRFIQISQETKSILGEYQSTKVYLARRLNTSPEVIEDIYVKIPALKTIRVTKAKKFIDFLISEGFEVEEIINKSRIFLASQNTVKHRLERLRKLGLKSINLNVLCRSRKDFQKYCESIETISKEQ